MGQLRILHVSDLHFGPPYVPEVGESLLESAARLELDLIVASGDFTQRAKPEQFQSAREFLDRLPPKPIIVVPGNHDVPLYRVVERIRDPYRYYRQYIAAELDHVTRLDGACIVGLNSTSPLRAVTNGRISRRQLEFCEQAFAGAADDDLRIVVAHHHFAPAPDYERASVMPHAKRAIDHFHLLNVDLILGGHLHRAYIGNSLDVYPGIDRDHGIIIVQCGTTTSRRGRVREREKNSFNLIQVNDQRVMIDHFIYFSDAASFAPVSRHLFARPHQQLVDTLTAE